MKTPKQLSEKLARQWHNTNTREKRLLEPACWPVELLISKPTATQLRQHLSLVRDHVEQWRNVTTGKVIWEEVKYRDSSEAIELPVRWQLQKPSEWIAATSLQSINSEFRKFSEIADSVDPLFHAPLIRQRHLIVDKTASEVIQACELALQLEQGCAHGLPLRALSITSIDTKFFERHRRLIIKLLDVRFDGLATEIGLEAFLDALDENDHWLLIVDLDGSLLPFKQMRIRDSELKSTELIARFILIVENEKCLHQIPQAEQTIAILGAGLNLSWMQATWLNNKNIAYWGDIDTWGLTMLAQARRFQSTLIALMMNQITFEKESHGKAVLEPKTAGATPPQELTTQEIQLYKYLLSIEKGRLEQEFLSPELVTNEVLNWANGKIFNNHPTHSLE